MMSRMDYFGLDDLHSGTGIDSTFREKSPRIKDLYKGLCRSPLTRIEVPRSSNPSAPENVESQAKEKAEVGYVRRKVKSTSARSPTTAVALSAEELPPDSDPPRQIIELSARDSESPLSGYTPRQVLTSILGRAERLETMPVHRAEPSLTTGEKRTWGVEMTPVGAKRLKVVGFEQFSTAQKKSQKPKGVLATMSGPLLANMTAAGAKHAHGGFEQFPSSQRKSQKPKGVSMTPAGAKHTKGYRFEQLSTVLKKTENPKSVDMTPSGVKHKSAGFEQFSTSQKKRQKTSAGAKLTNADMTPVGAKLPSAGQQQFSISEKKGRKSTSGRKSNPISKDRSGYVEESSDSETDAGPLPGFTVKMIRSNVTKGFWLTVPSKFALEHLPNEDVCVVLKDSRNVKWDTNYLFSKKGLSGGWRKFVNDQNLEEGDEAYFEKYKHCRFKVTLQKSGDRNFIPPVAKPQKFLANPKKSPAPSGLRDGIALFSGVKKKRKEEKVAQKSMPTAFFSGRKKKRENERVAEKNSVSKRQRSVFNRNGQQAHRDSGRNQNARVGPKSSLGYAVCRDNHPTGDQMKLVFDKGSNNHDSYLAEVLPIATKPPLNYSPEQFSLSDNEDIDDPLGEQVHMLSASSSDAEVDIEEVEEDEVSEGLKSTHHRGDTYSEFLMEQNEIFQEAGNFEGTVNAAELEIGNFEGSVNPSELEIGNLEGIVIPPEIDNDGCYPDSDNPLSFEEVFSIKTLSNQMASVTSKQGPRVKRESYQSLFQVPSSIKVNKCLPPSTSISSRRIATNSQEPAAKQSPSARPGNGKSLARKPRTARWSHFPGSGKSKPAVQFSSGKPQQGVKPPSRKPHPKESRR